MINFASSILRGKRRDIVPWRKILVGNYQDVSKLEYIITSLDIKISASCKQIMSQVELCREPEVLNLGTASVRELGLQHGSTVEQIYYAAARRKGVKCPPEVGLQLCVQYLDILPDILFWTAMEPIRIRVPPGRTSIPKIFCIRKNSDGVMSITTANGGMHSEFCSRARFVFMLSD